MKLWFTIKTKSNSIKKEILALFQKIKSKKLNKNKNNILF